MKPKYFREVDRTSSGKPWSKYNVVPYEISEADKNFCENCSYRASRLKEEFVGIVLGVVGFSTKYAKNKNLDLTPACDRSRCLLDNLVLDRGEKSPPSSLKRLLNPIKLNKTSRQNEQ